MLVIIKQGVSEEFESKQDEAKYLQVSEYMKGSTHYMSDKQEFDVSSKGPLISDEEKCRILVYRLDNELIF